MCKNKLGCDCWKVWKPVRNLDLTSSEVMWQFVQIEPYKGQTQSQSVERKLSMHYRKAFWWLCASKKSKLNLNILPLFIYLCRNNSWSSDFFLPNLLIDFSIKHFCWSIKCQKMSTMPKTESMVISLNVLF